VVVLPRPHPSTRDVSRTDRGAEAPPEGGVLLSTGRGCWGREGRHVVLGRCSNVGGLQRGCALDLGTTD
jgi:hypothetical protein